ncbi:MAG: hypothetical protein ACI857_003461 [Arenicella sp.]|jgi:hypothetical protein
MSLRQLAASIFTMALLTSCCKEEIQPTELPAITTSGIGMFACRINGEIFVRSDCGPYIQQFSPHYYSSGSNAGLFRILVYNDHHFDEELSIDLRIRDYYGDLGVVDITSEWDIRPIYDLPLDTLQPNYVEFLRFDTIEKVASGTFEFTCVNPQDSLEIWEITEGRFDMSNMRLNQ